MTSWRVSRDFVCEFLTQDTSGENRGGVPAVSAFQAVVEAASRFRDRAHALKRQLRLRSSCFLRWVLVSPTRQIQRRQLQVVSRFRCNVEERSEAHRFFGLHFGPRDSRLAASAGR